MIHRARARKRRRVVRNEIKAAARTHRAAALMNVCRKHRRDPYPYVDRAVADAIADLRRNYRVVLPEGWR